METHLLYLQQAAVTSRKTLVARLGGCPRTKNLLQPTLKYAYFLIKVFESYIPHPKNKS